MLCRHRRNMIARVHEPLTEVYGCSQFGSCTMEPSTLKSKGEPLANCETCPLYAARGQETYSAAPSSTSPTGFTWDCTPAQLQRIGFYPTSASDTVTVEPAAYVEPVGAAEPVGDILHEILTECGIKRSACSVCQQWQSWMNQGVQWCEANRGRILARLNDQAKSASWFESIRVAGRGYLTTESILDEAIKRAKSVA